MKKIMMLATIAMLTVGCDKQPEAAQAQNTAVKTEQAKPAVKVEKLTMEIGMKAMTNQDEVGAASVPYQRVVGHMVFAYFWARMAKVALEKESTDDFYKAKLATARFYFAKLLPETAGYIRQARAGNATLAEMQEDWF
jgi:hypothetical protein